MKRAVGAVFDGEIVGVVGVLMGLLALAAITASAGPRHAHGERCASVVACRHAIDWHKQHERRLREQAWNAASPTLLVAAKIAGATYGVDPWAMMRVAHCEVAGLARLEHRRYVDDRNSATATGAWQWLDSTWSQPANPYRAMDRTSVYVEALATAWLVKRDGGWREWSCGWAA